MKNLVEWLKRRTKKKASAEKSKEVADSQETTSGKSTATTSTGAEGSFVGDVSQRADLIAAESEEQFQNENQPSTGSVGHSSFPTDSKLIGTQNPETDEPDVETAYLNVDTSHSQYQLDDEESVEGSSGTASPTDIEVESPSIHPSDTLISNDVSERADEIASWFDEEQMLAGDPDLAESAEESSLQSLISDVSLKGSKKTESDSPVENLEDEEAKGEPNEIDSGIPDFNTDDSDDLWRSWEAGIRDVQINCTAEDNTYGEVEEIGKWFQGDTSETTPPYQDIEDYFPPSFETDLDDEFEETNSRSAKRTSPRIAVDTYQTWMRQVQRIQPQVRTTDNQISTKRLSAAQESELFQRFERIKQEVANLLDQFPSAVLKGLSAEDATEDVSKQQSRSELLSSVINTRNPLEQIRNAIDEMQAGLHSQEIVALNQLWQDLGCSVERIQVIKEEIFQNNLRLVMHIAKRYSSHYMETMDLVQEGFIGLMKAIDRFDVHKGYRFSTYATWWVRQAVRRTRDNDSHIIRLPNYVIEKHSAFLKSVSELTKKLRSEPTRLEIAEAMACSLNQIDGFFNLPIKPMRFNRRTVLETEAGRNAYHYGIDAEDEFQDEFQIWDATHEVELTQSRFLAELDEFTDFSHYRAEIASLLAPHEREVVEGHLGWNDAKLKPRLEIGIVLAIVRERGRQRRLLGREPSFERVIHAIGIPPRIIDEIRAIASEPFAFDRPIKSKTLVELALSLTQVCNQETLPDFLISESRISPEAVLDSQLNTDVMAQVLNTLSPREKVLLEHRFGLIDGREHTLAEIGRQLGISRERVRQIEDEALEKLRHPTRRHYLEELLSGQFQRQSSF